MRLGKLFRRTGTPVHLSTAGAPVPALPTLQHCLAARLQQEKTNQHGKGLKKITRKCLDLEAFLCRDVISPLAFETLLTSGKNLFFITHLHSPT